MNKSKTVIAQRVFGYHLWLQYLAREIQTKTSSQCATPLFCCLIRQVSSRKEQNNCSSNHHRQIFTNPIKYCTFQLVKLNEIPHGDKTSSSIHQKSSKCKILRHLWICKHWHWRRKMLLGTTWSLRYYSCRKECWPITFVANFAISMYMVKRCSSIWCESWEIDPEAFQIHEVDIFLSMFDHMLWGGRQGWVVYYLYSLCSSKKSFLNASQFVHYLGLLAPADHLLKWWNKLSS